MFPPVDQTRRQLLSVAAAGAVAAAIPAAAAAAPATELAAKFERLLDEYYARRMNWAPRFARAHAETDELFGEYRKEYEKFLHKACDRLAVHEAHDRMHDVGEQMKPLARAIVALPTISVEALRTKALVALWEVAPFGAANTQY
jgi:flavin-dependent dehydrogenase